MKLGTKKAKTIEEAFWARVAKSDGCWEWTGYLNNYGYGASKFKKRHYAAHRLSWELHKGSIPQGMHVCHTCDNPKCVNPDHLFLGTPADNTADMLSKNRQASKLSAEDVLAIRALPNRRYSERVALAKKFNVSASHIQSIAYKKVWRRLAG